LPESQIEEIEHIPEGVQVMIPYWLVEKNELECFIKD
jgi:hypothetical protein